MRTTVSIDDDLLNAARNMAEARGVPLGQVVSELMRKGMQAKADYDMRNGFPVFRVHSSSRPITLEDVKKAEDEP